MAVLNLDNIKQTLSAWRPEFYPRHQSLSDATDVVQVSQSSAALTIHLGYPARHYAQRIKEMTEAHLRDCFPALESVRVEIDWAVKSHAVQRHLTVSKEVRNVIAVGSGKGGVGKSTVAVNLALALAAEGARVGLLDADIYGPSQPMMLGIDQAPECEDGKTMIPLQAHGLQVISVGFLVDEEKPIVWRGPMASAAFRQLFEDCAWDNLDYLVVDLPPGTGDIQLTLAQRIPVTGAVVVSTPQAVAVADARKSVRMFEKVSVPVLGLVENMSAFHCPGCGQASAIFGEGGVQALGRELGTDVLAMIPLNSDIGKHSDQGTPDVIASPDSDSGRAFFQLAHRTMVAVAGRPNDYTRKFGPIKVQAAPEAAAPGK